MSAPVSDGRPDAYCASAWRGGVSARRRGSCRAARRHRRDAQVRRRACSCMSARWRSAATMSRSRGWSPRASRSLRRSSMRSMRSLDRSRNRGFDRRPAFFLIGRQPQSGFEAGNASIGESLRVLRRHLPARMMSALILRGRVRAGRTLLRINESGTRDRKSGRTGEHHFEHGDPPRMKMTQA